jgi:type I restriction enzyme M protein
MTKNEHITVTDYISGIGINATPEEIEAVQVFSRQLVEDYGYPNGEIIFEEIPNTDKCS